MGEKAICEQVGGVPSLSRKWRASQSAANQSPRAFPCYRGIYRENILKLPDTPSANVLRSAVLRPFRPEFAWIRSREINLAEQGRGLTQTGKQRTAIVIRNVRFRPNADILGDRHERYY
jgi:hypothetical protein